MRIERVNPERVLPWDHRETYPKFVELALEGRLHEVNPAPVYEIDDERYSHLGDFVLFDGHHRREAALRAGVDLDILIIETQADYKHVLEAKNNDWYTNMHSILFEREKVKKLVRALMLLGINYNYQR